jgi:orotate phosphoribosyltransferase
MPEVRPRKAHRTIAVRCGSSSAAIALATRNCCRAVSAKRQIAHERSQPGAHPRSASDRIRRTLEGRDIDILDDVVGGMR